MARVDGGERTGPEGAGRPSGVLPLAGLAAAWIILCLFGVAPVSLLVEGFASVAGNPGLASNVVFTAAAECLFYLALAFAVFRVGRMLCIPGNAWPLGPLGYLVSFALQTLGMWLVLFTDALPRGTAWAFIVADTAATAAGAWIGLRPEATAVGAETEAA